jgi:hypothetical protein
MKKPAHITKFTIETERTFIFRSFGSRQRAWCPGCDADVQMATVGNAAREAGLSELAVYQLAEEGLVHFVEDAAGRVFVCLNSLLK